MKKVCVTLIVFVLLLTTVSCSKNTGSGQNSIVGKWNLTSTYSVDGWTPVDSTLTYEFKDDGTYVRSDGTTTIEGTYKINGGQIELTMGSDSVTYNLTISGNTLQFNNADSGLKLVKVQ